MSMHGSSHAEITCAERRRRFLAALLAFGPPVLLALITTSVVWLEDAGIIVRRFEAWVFVGNAALAATGAASAALIRPGTPPRKRALGIVAGAVAGVMMYAVVLNLIDSLIDGGL